MIILGTIMAIGLSKIAISTRTTTKARDPHLLLIRKITTKLFHLMIAHTMTITPPHTNNINSIPSKEFDPILLRHWVQGCIQRVCLVSTRLRDQSIRRYFLRTNMKLPNSQIQTRLQINFRNIQVALKKIQDWLPLLFSSPISTRNSSIVFLPLIWV